MTHYTNVGTTSTVTINNAKLFAVKNHGDQKYGDEFPYAIHLQACESVLLRFGLTDAELRICAWLHDVLEDTVATYEDVELYFGTRVASIVSAVTEPKGGNRAWRHSQTYPRIRLLKEAVIIKLADRIANVEFSGKRRDMYKKEYGEFKKALYLSSDPDVILQMWSHLDSLMI